MRRCAILNLYYYLEGANRDPAVRVSYHTDEATYENPLHIVATAGKGFENSPIYQYYLTNDSTDIEYTDLIFLTIDNDTADGSNENTWYQYRVLMEYTNSASQPEAKWSNWKTTLDWSQDVAGNITDSLGATIAIPNRVLTYYKNSSTSDFVRDIVTIQVRVSIPIDTGVQMKTDLTPSLRATTNPNYNNGRP